MPEFPSQQNQPVRSRPLYTLYYEVQENTGTWRLWPDILAAAGRKRGNVRRNSYTDHHGLQSTRIGGRLAGDRKFRLPVQVFTDVNQLPLGGGWEPAGKSTDPLSGN